MALVKFDQCPMFASYGTKTIDTIRGGLLGQKRVKFVIPMGDSNEDQSGAGGFSQVCKNIALLRSQAGINKRLIYSGLSNTGANSGGYWIMRSPVRNAVAGGTALESHAMLATDFSANGGAALLAAAPPNWGTSLSGVNNGVTNVPYVVASHNTNQQGFFLALQAFQDYAPPELGVGGIGRGVQMWDRTPGQTYVDLCLMCSQYNNATPDLAAANEIRVLVTANDTLNAGTTGASPTQTFVSGVDFPALNLREFPLLSDGTATATPVYKWVRVGPVNFENGGVTKKTINVNVLGNGGVAVVVCGGFCRPNDKGCGFETVSAKGGLHPTRAMANYPRSGQVFQKYVANDPGADHVIFYQMGLNSIYVSPYESATVAAQSILDHVKWFRTYMGNLPVVLCPPHYKDNSENSSTANDQYDDQYDLLMSALKARVDAGDFGDCLLINGRLASHVMGCNAASERIRAFSVPLGDTGHEVPNMVAGAASQFQIFAATNTLTTGQLVACPGANAPLLVAVGGSNVIHPFGSSGVMTPWGGAVRLFNAVGTGGISDGSHYSPPAYKALRQWEWDAVKDAVFQAGAQGGGNTPYYFVSNFVDLEKP